MYLSDQSLMEDSTSSGRRRGPLSYREAQQLADRRMFEEYSRACAGVTRIKQLRREASSPADPVLFWEKVINWIPKLFEMKRTGERLVREGRRSRAEIDEMMRRNMRFVYPPDYMLGTEEQELARARCALAEARWHQQAAVTPPAAPLVPPIGQSTRATARQLEGYAFGERVRVRTPLTSAPPHLPYLTLDNFVHASSALTGPHLDKIRFLAGAVDASWNSPKPIVEIRLVGHTDNTGRETFNVGLGDRRAESVKTELGKHPGIANRVSVVVGPSPGETQPTATNTTTKGMALNRRVEVFVIFGVKPLPPDPPPPPQPPPCIDPRKCIKPPDEPPPPDWFGPIGPGRQGQSFEQWLKEVLARLPKPIAWAIRKALITGACATLEYLLGQVVGRLSESEKDQIRKECQAQAKKPR